MKKVTMLLAVAAICCTQAFAQNSNSTDREQRRTELIGRWAERWSKDFELTGDKKTNFEKLFAEYQNEMFSTNRSGSRNATERTRERATEQETKELSTEEATQKLQESIQNQEEMITRMQKRVEIQKKYQREFGKILTAQQVLKVMSPAPRNQGNANNGEQRGNRNRGMGGFGRSGGSRTGF